MSYTIEIKNLEQLRGLFQRAPELTQKWLEKAVAASTVAIFKKAVRGVLPWKTGTLTQTMRYEITGMRGKVFPTRNYAIFVHEGTRPHRIEAKPGGALFWPGALHPVKAVNHPGNQPNRFLPRMLALATPEINKYFQEAGDNITKELKT